MMRTNFRELSRLKRVSMEKFVARSKGVVATVRNGASSNTAKTTGGSGSHIKTMLTNMFYVTPVCDFLMSLTPIIGEYDPNVDTEQLPKVQYYYDNDFFSHQTWTKILKPAGGVRVVFIFTLSCRLLMLRAGHRIQSAPHALADGHHQLQSFVLHHTRGGDDMLAVRRGSARTPQVLGDPGER